MVFGRCIVWPKKWNPLGMKALSPAHGSACYKQSNHRLKTLYHCIGMMQSPALPHGCMGCIQPSSTDSFGMFEVHLYS